MTIRQVAFRLAVVLVAAAAIAAAVTALNVAATRRSAAAIPAVPMADAHIVPARDAIAHEALPLVAALPAPAATTQRAAHPRTLATFRALRAYPGAPPRVPHGITAAEFRTSGCRTCHERGGYSPRFSAWTPVTPHPALTDCLACHTTDDAVTGMALPGSSPDDVCRQCHGTEVMRRAAANVDWRAAEWPSPAPVTGMPPTIPHALQLRENCVACHAGPGAVREIRTAHPERGNCRQCHLEQSGLPGEYVRVPADAGGHP